MDRYRWIDYPTFSVLAKNDARAVNPSIAIMEASGHRHLWVVHFGPPHPSYARPGNRKNVKTWVEAWLYWMEYKTRV